MTTSLQIETSELKAKRRVTADHPNFIYLMIGQIATITETGERVKLVGLRGRYFPEIKKVLGVCQVQKADESICLLFIEKLTFPEEILI